MCQLISTDFLKKTSAPFLLLAAMLFLSACSTRVSENIPSDFYMMIDVHEADRKTAKNINLRIDANGNVEYDIYETGGVIHYDENDVVRYEKNQIVRNGKFSLTTAQMESLWAAINDTHFFELSDKYQMQIGHSYAFIMVEADGNKHMVDNIGMEVAEMRTLVETLAAMMPDGIEFEYGQGYIP